MSITVTLIEMAFAICVVFSGIFIIKIFLNEGLPGAIMATILSALGTGAICIILAVGVDISHRKTVAECQELHRTKAVNTLPGDWGTLYGHLRKNGSNSLTNRVVINEFLNNDSVKKPKLSWDQMQLFDNSWNDDSIIDFLEDCAVSELFTMETTQAPD